MPIWTICDYSANFQPICINQRREFSLHTDKKIAKSNKLLGMIRHTFKFLDAETLLLLYKSLIRPHVEYATPVWSPHLKGDRDKIEKLQRRTTKLVPNLRDKPYEERLRVLKLPTLEFRRLRQDLILLYKHTPFNQTRHKYILYLLQTQHKHVTTITWPMLKIVILFCNV